VGAWLHRVTINLCYDHFRRQRLTVELSPDHPDPSPTPECIFRSNEERARIWHAVMRLSRKERFTLVQCCIEGRTSEETGRLMHAPPATIRSRVRCARRKIARQLLPSASTRAAESGFGGRVCGEIFKTSAVSSSDPVPDRLQRNESLAGHAAVWGKPFWPAAVKITPAR
jgi:hypothetical protein